MDMPKLSPLPIRTKGKSFLSKLQVWVTEIRTWELTEDWEYDLTDQKKIIIPKGFIFDGASIPRPLWAILSPVGLLLIPGLIHDFGYRFDYIWTLDGKGFVYKGYENAGQEFWDKIFYEVSEKVNGMTMVNKLAWLALASMGTLAWKSHRNRKPIDLLPNIPIQVVN